MTELTFYGGVGEIGGNKIMVEDQGTKLLFDFGMSFGKRSRFFEEFLTPRTANGIGDFLAMGLIPDVEGLYREDLLKHQGRSPEEPEVAAVFLSHAHADHANDICFLHRDIPVYCGETCKSILEAVQEQSRRTIDCEVLDFKRRPLFRSDYRKPPVNRRFEVFRTGDKISIDSLEVEPIHVDHSVPGAYGFIIHTSSGPVVYSGDLRVHGSNSEMTLYFIERAKEEEPVAMILEGTRIDEEKTDESEAKVYAESKREVVGTGGLPIVDFNFKDVDRFKTFYRIAVEVERNLVISFKHACFLERYHQDPFLDVPDSTGENIFLLKPKLMTGTYDDSDYGDDYIKRRLSYPNILTAEEIAEDQKKYMVVLNFWYFNTLIDLQPRDSVYIHSLSEPFNEETELSYERMMNWVEHFRLRLVQSHCSGHASGTDLRGFVDSIRPESLFPIHTEHPEWFKGLKTRTVMVEEGVNYEI